MTRTINVGPYTRSLPGRPAAFVVMTKVLAGLPLNEREWDAFIGRELASDLDEKLSGYFSPEEIAELREIY